LTGYADTRFKRRPRFGCSMCHEDFNSLNLFEAHKTDTLPSGDRDCMSTQDMLDKGWKQNSLGRWYDPAHAAEVRQAFSAFPDDRTGPER